MICGLFWETKGKSNKMCFFIYMTRNHSSTDPHYMIIVTEKENFFSYFNKQFVINLYKSYF